MNSDINLFCENLYAEVQQYWESKRDFLPRTWALKFGIFYSPVRYRPALMIVGANPGFDSDDDTKSPPVENLFYDPKERNEKEWRISARLLKLFQIAGREHNLRYSVVTNLLFFKSRCLNTHTATGQGWCDNGNPKIRREIEGYCRVKVEQIVNKVDPARILVLGLTTWDRLADEPLKLRASRTKGRGRLAVAGTVFNREALGIAHPTGARISDTECHQLATLLDQFLVSTE